MALKKINLKRAKFLFRKKYIEDSLRLDDIMYQLYNPNMNFDDLSKNEQNRFACHSLNHEHYLDYCRDRFVNPV